MVLLEVQDEGPGIPPDEQDRLFTKFSRLSPRPTGGEPSTGLGLYIVERLVSAMGGAVACESEPPGGAVFRVTLPAAGAPAEDTPPPEA